MESANPSTNSITVHPPDQQTLDRAKLFKVMTQEEWGNPTDDEIITFTSSGDRVSDIKSIAQNNETR